MYLLTLSDLFISECVIFAIIYIYNICFFIVFNKTGAKWYSNRSGNRHYNIGNINNYNYLVII